MIHPMPTQVLLTTTFESLVKQLSGSLARGVRLIDQFIHEPPTPQKMMEFESELSALLREVGRRIMTWVLNRLEREADDEAAARVEFEGRRYRRRGHHPNTGIFAPRLEYPQRSIFEARGKNPALGCVCPPLKTR